MSRWNFGWISPWSYAFSHLSRVQDELKQIATNDNKKATELLSQSIDIMSRYVNGERTTKLYFDMFQLSLKGIKKYVK